jgi:hypothetical protein
MAKSLPETKSYQLKPRRRIVRRVLPLLMVALLGGHQWWSYREDQQLICAVESLRRAGEPMRPEEFQPATVSDPDNAAIDLGRAASSLPVKAEDWNYLDVTEIAAPLTPAEALRIRRVVETHAGVLRHVRAATTKAGVDWGQRFETPVILGPRPDLYPQRDVADFLGMIVLLAHHEGDDAEALRLVDDLLFMSRAAGEHPTITSRLTGTCIAEVATTRLAQITPSLCVDAWSSRAATTDQVRALITALLDDETPQRGALRALRAERAWQQDSIRAIVDGKMTLQVVHGGRKEVRWSDDVLRFAFKPLILSDARLMLRQAATSITAVRAPDRPTARERVSGLEGELRSNWPTHLVARMLTPYYEQFLGRHYLDLTNRRLAASALAARWYAVEHAGELPALSNQLVPRYLPSIPHDPMASSKPLVFVSDATAPRVYSVGDNGTDEGGSCASRLSCEHPRGWQCYDVVVHLTPQPRALVDVSTKPQEEPIDMASD